MKNNNKNSVSHAHNGFEDTFSVRMEIEDYWRERLASDFICNFEKHSRSKRARKIYVKKNGESEINAADLKSLSWNWSNVETDEVLNELLNETNDELWKKLFKRKTFKVPNVLLSKLVLETSMDWEIIWFQLFFSLINFNGFEVF